MVTRMLYQGRIISFEAAALCKQKEVEISIPSEGL